MKFSKTFVAFAVAAVLSVAAVAELAYSYHVSGDVAPNDLTSPAVFDALTNFQNTVPANTDVQITNVDTGQYAIYTIVSSNYSYIKSTGVESGYGGGSGGDPGGNGGGGSGTGGSWGGGWSGGGQWKCGTVGGVRKDCTWVPLGL